MAKYIDADNLINELSAACMPIYEKGITGILGDNSSIADIINEQPTADVQEVKRGKWVKPGNDQDHKQWICSECKGLIETACYCWHCYYNYCPNCGARMEEFEE
nr:MAG TPA: rubredoxin iron binding domains containing a [Caudoviricetes sp.]